MERTRNYYWQMSIGAMGNGCGTVGRFIASLAGLMGHETLGYGRSR